MLYTILAKVARFDASHGAGKAAEAGALRALAMHPRLGRGGNTWSTVELRSVLAAVYLDRHQPRLAGLALSQDSLDLALGGGAGLDVLAYAYTVAARRLRMLHRTAEASDGERKATLKNDRIRTATNVSAAKRMGGTVGVEAGLVPGSCASTLPEEAKAYGLEGSVRWAMAVAADGSSKDHKLIKSSGYTLLDQAVGQSLPACRFTPATQDGVAVAAYATSEHTFSLDAGNRPAMLSLAKSDRCLAKASFMQVPDLIDAGTLKLRYLVDASGVPYAIKVEAEGDAGPAQRASQALQGCRFAAAAPGIARRAGTIWLVSEPPVR